MARNALDPALARQIEHACQRLMYRYCHLVDHGEAGQVADLFTEDGECEIVPGRPMRGKTILAKVFAARQAQAGLMSKHVCTTAVIDVIDEDRAIGTVYLTLFRHEGEPGRVFSPLEGPFMVGEYRDEFARTVDGWRFAKRSLHVEFRREAP